MKNLVNGNLIDSKEKISIYSPIDNSFIGEVPSMSKEEVDYCYRTSKEAFSSWKNLSMVERREYLYKMANKIEQVKEDIAKTMVLEIAKPYKDSLIEIERSIDFIRFTADEGQRINGELIEGGNFSKSSNNKISMVRYIPYGVVLCIAPFNYPINLSISKIVTALIGGNTVVFKPPTQGSVSSLKMIEAISDVLPKGVLNSVTGKGSKIGDYLNTHELVDFINFTGSTNVGKSISNQIGMIPTIMELGGKDACIVLEDADIQKATKNILSGAFNYSGQRCTAIKRVLVQRKVSEQLINELNLGLLKLKVGSAKDNNDICEVIDEKTANYIEDLIKETIELKRDTKQVFKRENNLIYPMIFYNVKRTDRIAIEEPFGPVLPVITFDTIEEAIEIANESSFGLQSSVFTKDIDKAFEIAKKLEVGTVHINNKTQRGPDNFPFLGYKDSGIGVQGIRNSIMSMLRIKSIVIDI